LSRTLGGPGGSRGKLRTRAAAPSSSTSSHSACSPASSLRAAWRSRSRRSAASTLRCSSPTSSPVPSLARRVRRARSVDRL